MAEEEQQPSRDWSEQEVHLIVADYFSMLQAEMQNVTSKLALTPEAGQMIHTGWIFIAPLGTGRYAVFLHAEGLEPPSSGGYIVEGVTRSGMKMVPLGPNATASEFVASANGIGHYWLVLNQNPSVNYEAIDVLYLAIVSAIALVVVGTRLRLLLLK